MSLTPSSDSASFEGATAVVTHRVCEGKHGEYEQWIEEITPLVEATPGHLDSHIVRPVRGLSETYTIIIRFDTNAHLRDWMDSSTRARMIEKATPLLVTGDDFYVSSGLDFWFAPSGAQAQVPVRWKQCVVTWSAIYLLVLSVPYALSPVLQYLGISENRYISTLVLTGTVVFLMVYVVMPRYTKLIHRWLFS